MTSEEKSETILDVKQLGMVAAIASLGYVFWCVGVMEMIERLAYYGVRAVAGIYAKDPVSRGGLGITPSQLGTIFFYWAIAQNFVAAFTGGLSDRYGYKLTIAVSTVVKISGYLVMAIRPTYGCFLWGAILLATGTAIFKPGIQGTLVKTTSRKNSSVAWGIFYQTVNIGGFIGPLLAGYMRKLAWQNVFLTCAGIICLNFLMLLLYREPGKEERLERTRLRKEGKLPKTNLFEDAMREIAKPRVFLYLLIFTGFWFMFFGIFDLLPLHIDDWINTRPVIAGLFGPDGTQNEAAKFFLILDKTGTVMQPEGVVNLNALLIMTTCFFVAALSAKMPAITSIVVGILLATVSYLIFGSTFGGWLVILAVLVYSVGEMLSSPKFSEFIGNFAPGDKKAMYLGFSQIPVGVGMMLEGKIGPVLYDHFASKERFARELLVERGMAADLVARIPQGEAFGRLVAHMNADPWAVTAELASRHQVGTAWMLMAAVGLASGIGMWLYGRWVKRDASPG